MTTKNESPETDFNTLYWRRAVDVFVAFLIAPIVPVASAHAVAVDVVGRSRAIDLLCALETQGRAVLESDGYRITPEAEAKAARERHAMRERLIAWNPGFSR